MDREVELKERTRVTSESIDEAGALATDGETRRVEGALLVRGACEAVMFEYNSSTNRGKTADEQFGPRSTGQEGIGHPTVLSMRMGRL